LRLPSGSIQKSTFFMPDLPDLKAGQDTLVDKAMQAAHRLPAFGEGSLVRSWSGLYDTTPDWNPVLVGLERCAVVDLLPGRDVRRRTPIRSRAPRKLA
jgi:glycine/D-amino acid oxidase-like deaminating enzyme